MVYRLFVEKKEGLRVEAEALQAEIRDLLGVSALKSLRLLNRYEMCIRDRLAAFGIAKQVLSLIKIGSAAIWAG